MNPESTTTFGIVLTVIYIIVSYIILHLMTRHFIKDRNRIKLEESQSPQKKGERVRSRKVDNASSEVIFHTPESKSNKRDISNPSGDTNKKLLKWKKR